MSILSKLFGRKPVGIISKLQSSQLSRVSNDLIAMLQPAIRLETSPCPEDALALGATRIGGRPDLPDDIIWPVWNGTPLAFLAQINLADLAQFPCANVLPQEGWLNFFYDVEQSTWGFDPNDKGSWAVVYVPKTSAKLGRREIPPGIPDLYAPYYTLCSVRMREIVTPMPWDSPAVDKLGLTSAERDAYIDLFDEIYAEGEGCHQILGHPQQEQGDMQVECQLVSNGFYGGDSIGYKDPKAIELVKSAGDWRLLFQLDTDDSAKMMWGDAGKLYFWMHKESLAASRFQECWMILQCG